MSLPVTVTHPSVLATRAVWSTLHSHRDSTTPCMVHGQLDQQERVVGPVASSPPPPPSHLCISPYGVL